MTEPFIGHFDLAQLVLYAFWIFFAGLVFYIQRENMRDGYPLEDETTGKAKFALFGIPAPKIFKLPHGRGEVAFPNDWRETRDLPMQRVSPSAGSPYEPTGDAMLAGVGPGAWAERMDEVELDGHGHPKIIPMSAVPDFFVRAGVDPRGRRVVAGDKIRVGTVTDIWVDRSEQIVRYIEAELDEGGGKVLIPMALAKVKTYGVIVLSIYARHFPEVPRTAAPDVVTMLEEEKIMAYYCGGKLYADRDRSDAKL